MEANVNIERVQLSWLNPAEYNPRKRLRPGDAEYERLKTSIQQFGYVDPIICNADGTIIGGHQRFFVLQDIGAKEADVSIVDLDKAKEKALNIALNKISGDWNDEKLKTLLQDLDAEGFELSLTGFSDDELSDLLGDVELETDAVEDDYDFEKEVPARAKIHEVWQLGVHRVICGDATSEEDVNKVLNGGVIDLYLTDPPYNIDYEGKTAEKLKIQNDKKADGEFQEFLTDAFNAVQGHMSPGAAFYIWHADSQRYNFETACNNVGWKIRENLIWSKNVFTLGRQDYQWKHEPCLYGWDSNGSHRWYSDRCQATVLEYDKPMRNAEHPTMKPIPLFAYLIQNSSKKGDLVFDSFAGSGTTVLACEQTGRVACVMELDPHYVDVIIDRWENFTGKKAKRIK